MGLALGLSAAGTAISAAGKIKAGKDAKKTGEINREIGLAQADDALNRGTIEESRYRRELAQIIGAQKASFGRRNVAVSGTPLDILSDTSMIGEEDINTIRNNAAREAWGYRHQAAQSYREGKSAYQNSLLGAGSTLLTGGSQAYGIWKNRGK